MLKYCVWLFTLLVASSATSVPVVLPEKLVPTSVTYERLEGRTTRATLMYESPEPASFIWASRIGPIEPDSETFEASNGTGMSRVVTNYTIEGVGVFTQGGNLFYLIWFNREFGEFNIPEINITYDGGEEISYVPGVPLDMELKWSKHPQMEPRGRRNMEYFFLGLDPSNSGNSLVMWSPYINAAHSPVQNVEEITLGDYHHAFAELTLEDESGLVLVSAEYRSGKKMGMYVAKVLPIHPEGQDPFPANYIEFADMFGMGNFYCRLGDTCVIYCLPFGPNITSVELRESSGSVMTSFGEIRGEWYNIAAYKIPENSSDLQRNFTCTVTNINGNTKQKMMTVQYFNPYKDF